MTEPISNDGPNKLEVPEWRVIREAGGREAWVEQELQRRGLVDDSTDPSSLDESAKKSFKARREEERRVRSELEKASWIAFKRAKIVHLGAGIFYNDAVDSDRYDLDDPKTRREKNDLPDLKDAEALAKYLDIDMRRLRQLTYHRDVDTGSNYIRWLIPKRTGGLRLISAPKKELKRIQRVIAADIVEHLPVHGAAHGFLTGRSTKTNALPHAGARVLLKLDLSDFYPTITVPRVKGLFRKAGFGEQVATLLALLVTESPREPQSIGGKNHFVATGPRSLPQGAPTSPSITNTLCLRLDSRLDGLAAKQGFVYTRYADDLTFSTRVDGKGGDKVGRLMAAVRRIVAEEGFIVHPKKTRVMRGGRRQKVTGLIVNAASDVPKTRVPRKLVRTLRAAIHNRAKGKEGPETLEQLRGYAAYVSMTDPKRGREFMSAIEALETRTPRKE